MLNVHFTLKVMLQKPLILQLTFNPLLLGFYGILFTLYGCSESPMVRWFSFNSKQIEGIQITNRRLSTSFTLLFALGKCYFNLVNIIFMMMFFLIWMYYFQKLYKIFSYLYRRIDKHTTFDDLQDIFILLFIQMNGFLQLL